MLTDGPMLQEASFTIPAICYVQSRLSGSCIYSCHVRQPSAKKQAISPHEANPSHCSAAVQIGSVQPPSAVQIGSVQLQIQAST